MEILLFVGVLAAVTGIGAALGRWSFKAAVVVALGLAALGWSTCTGNGPLAPDGGARCGAAGMLHFVMGLFIQVAALLVLIGGRVGRRPAVDPPVPPAVARR